MVCARVECNAGRERSKHTLRRCAARGEVLPAPMHVEHFGFRYRPAYSVQRRLYVNERAEPHPARAPVYRQEPTIPGAMLTWLIHLHGVTESEGRRV